MKALVLPKIAPESHKLYHYLKHLEIEQTTNPMDEDIGVAIHHHITQDAVFSLPKGLEQFNAINKEIISVKKDFIETAFAEVFGYNSHVNPYIYNGYCIEKSVRNATHDGKFVKCPLSPKDDKIYQKIIDTRISPTRLRDIRVVIMGNKIPVVFTKEFDSSKMFIHGLSDTKAAIVEPLDVLSKENLNNILSFASLLKVDFGELDVLISNETGLLYIVDVNPTPGVNLLRMVEGSTEILANHFKNIFL